MTTSRQSADTTKPAVTKAVEYKVIATEPLKKVYVQVKDPDDHSLLLQLKQVCAQFPGVSDVVLVLGNDKKTAIKMPFRVDQTDALVGELVKILGEDAVILK